ncbi:MAG: glycosyltransferase family 4 protein [Cytophagaceae bacterium]|nr:glycosyltransferase family 4 protein [Gemmatimonadaceae bacterium]
MRLLVVNWQDRENRQAGGAEIHLHEIFGRLAQRGHEVTLLCSGWPGCPSTARLDGMSVHRVGTRYTYPFLAAGAFRRLRPSHSWDLIIEDINKVPLFTPRWSDIPVVGVVPHLFGGTAFQEVPMPVAAAVWAAERPIPWVYRGIPFEVISESTADDLVQRGIPRDSIRVIYCGIDSESYTPAPEQRSATPLFSYLGRLKRYKRVDLILQAFARIDRPAARLEIAGAGDYRANLERLAGSLDLGDRVRFLGRISEDEKVSLLRRSWALAFTSPKEGWGITNLEAAASGTPVVASDSPGIRESVRHGETGFLVPHGDVGALALAMRKIADDVHLVQRMGQAGRVFAQSFTWERSADETEAHLRSTLAKRA